MNPNLVLDLHEGEYRAQLYRRGPKAHTLYLHTSDAVGYVWKHVEHDLRVGRSKAMAAALAYWEMWKIKEGGSV